MNDEKYISDLITSPEVFKPKHINIIDAPVSSGKTTFALTTLPKWTGNRPERILYLIDTTNGDLSIQRNIVATSRLDYAFWGYNTDTVWGERATDHKMPVMTYAGLGSEALKNTGSFNYMDYDYIVCDELQNLVWYQGFKNDDEKIPQGNKLLGSAEAILRSMLLFSNAKVIAISATPERIRKNFGKLCYDVPYDRSQIKQLETFEEIPYSCDLVSVISQFASSGDIRKTGILYTANICDMEKIIQFARKSGLHANGFWSIHAEQKMSDEQLILRQFVLDKETIPDDIDLLVINAASETCIKIKEEKRKVDYMIIHNSNKEVQTQVRGRYHGDLPVLYYYDNEEANLASCSNLPEHFLDKRLYMDEQKELVDYVKCQNPRKAKGTNYSMRKIREYLETNGYNVEHKKDRKNSGKHYYLITR